jgi:hypothetical protein
MTIERLPVFLVRRCDGPRGRGKRLLGYAQFRGTVAQIEAHAFAQGFSVRTRPIPPERADRILALAKDATLGLRRRSRDCRIAPVQDWNAP